MKSSSESNDKPLNIWTKRFIAASIIQGAIIVALTIFLVLSQISILKPEISRVIASGGAGTWFTTTLTKQITCYVTSANFPQLVRSYYFTMNFNSLTAFSSYSLTTPFSIPNICTGTSYWFIHTLCEQLV